MTFDAEHPWYPGYVADTPDVGNLTIARSAKAATASASATYTTETVIATYSNLIALRRTTDAILSWFKCKLSLTDGSTGGVTLTVRIRRGTTTGGALVHQGSLTIAGGKTGGTTVAVRIIDFDLEAPGSTDTQSFVLTAELTGADAGAASATVTEAKFLVQAKSA
jgi:hypothetical protein